MFKILVSEYFIQVSCKNTQIFIVHHKNKSIVQVCQYVIYLNNSVQM